jgi:hypothetical protein
MFLTREDVIQQVARFIEGLPQSCGRMKVEGTCGTIPGLLDESGGSPLVHGVPIMLEQIAPARKASRERVARLERPPTASRAPRD